MGGSDNAHFNGPLGVAVDASGNIYVADTGNHRVQVFNSSRAWQMTMGVTGQGEMILTTFGGPATSP